MAGVAVSLGAASVALSAPLVDQSNEEPPTSSASFGQVQTVSRGQSFTVGLAGVLTHVEVDLSPGAAISAPVVLEIQTTSGGLPSGTVVASASLPLHSVVADFNTFDIRAAGLIVSPGEVLAIVLKSDDANSYEVINGGSAPYAGGVSLEASGGVWSEDPSFDIRFRTLVLQGNVWGGAEWGVLVWGVAQDLPTVHAVGLLTLSALLAGLGAFLTRRRNAALDPARRGVGSNLLRLGLLLLLALLPPVVYASAVALPHTFLNKTVTDADAMNENFSVVETAVDDNDSHIQTLDNLLDQSCPAGHYATGVNAMGNLVCDLP